MRATEVVSATEVTLEQILDRREARCARQYELLKEWRLPLVCFTMNIPGPVKCGALISMSFEAGCEALSAAAEAAHITAVYAEKLACPTGYEAFYVFDGDAGRIKELCVAIEERHPLGRVFDLDVFDADGEKPDRESHGGTERGCVVCGAPGKGCSSRRLHTADQVYRAISERMRSYFREKCQSEVSSLCCRAIMYEVAAAPKPGLVTRHDSGSHSDMDIFTFIDSCASLLRYWRDAVRVGQETAGEPPEQSFRQLRPYGILAEREMFSATGGVNTHKGAVFLLGTLCAAIGRLSGDGVLCRDPELIAEECAKMSAQIIREELETIKAGPARSKGESIYKSYGLSGVRGEVAGGLRSVLEWGLPALREAVASGKGLEEAGSRALLALISNVADTNLISRGGVELQRAAAERTRAIRAAGFPAGELADAGEWFVKNNLSPGGCADLLAASYFMLFLSVE